ncbi:MAG: hypothetical protein ACLFQK_00860 [Fibrobacterota bacterium]
MSGSEKLSSVKTAEAHLYLAVAKADGVFSSAEKARVAYYAADSRKFTQIFHSKDGNAKGIKKELESLIDDPSLTTWSADDHLEKALSMLREAVSRGDYTARNAARRNRKGLQSLAYLEDYDYRESSFLKKVFAELEKLEKIS